MCSHVHQTHLPFEVILGREIIGAIAHIGTLANNHHAHIGHEDRVSEKRCRDIDEALKPLVTEMGIEQFELLLRDIHIPSP